MNRGIKSLLIGLLAPLIMATEPLPPITTTAEVPIKIESLDYSGNKITIKHQNGDDVFLDCSYVHMNTPGGEYAHTRTISLTCDYYDSLEIDPITPIYMTNGETREFHTTTIPTDMTEGSMIGYIYVYERSLPDGLQIIKRYDSSNPYPYLYTVVNPTYTYREDLPDYLPFRHFYTFEYEDDAFTIFNEGKNNFAYSFAKVKRIKNVLENKEKINN